MAFLVGFCAWGFSVYGQSSHFSTGTLNLSAGSSILQNDAMNPPLMLSAEYGAMEYLGVGAYAGYALAVKKDFLPVFDGNEWVLRNLYKNFFMIGAHADFHFWDLMEGSTQSEWGKKVDVFATGYLGARFIRRCVAQRNSGYTFKKNNQFFWGASITGRYYVAPNLAAYLEAGRIPSGYLGFGVTYQLPSP